MKNNYIPSGFSILVGLSIIGSWTAIILSGQMSELQTEPFTALLHLSAEMTTAALLLVGAYGMLAGRWWSNKIHLASLGMLLYAVIQASGYYFQHDSLIMVVLFLVIAVLTIFFVRTALLKDRDELYEVT